METVISWMIEEVYKYADSSGWDWEPWLLVFDDFSYLFKESSTLPQNRKEDLSLTIISNEIYFMIC